MSKNAVPIKLISPSDLGKIYRIDKISESIVRELQNRSDPSKELIRNASKHIS